MKSKFNVYKYDEEAEVKQYHILTIGEAFTLIGDVSRALPTLTSGNSINIPELEKLMKDRDVVWLIHENERWVITKILK